MELQWLKVCVLIGMFTLTFIMSMLPIKLVRAARGNMDPSRRERNMRIISFFSCFAGGVFLATCLLDLFPDVRDKLSDVFDRLNIISAFPIAEFVMILGFFIVLIVEQCILTWKEGILVRQLEQSKPLLSRAASIESIRENIETSYEGISDQPRLQTNIIKGMLNSYGAIEENGDVFEHEHVHEHSMHEDPSSHSTLRSIMLTLALSLHSIFEGLAVGLQASTAQVLDIFVALIIHKSILAFSLGLNLAESKLTVRRMVQSNFIFSISSPIGIAIGIGIMDLNNSLHSSMVSGLLQGVACGTFLYITFFEVLPHEMNSPQDRLIKVLCIIVGFSVISAILLIHPSVIRPTCYRGAEPVHNVP